MSVIVEFCSLEGDNTSRFTPTRFHPFISRNSQWLNRACAEVGCHTSFSEACGRSTHHWHSVPASNLSRFFKYWVTQLFKGAYTCKSDTCLSCSLLSCTLRSSVLLRTMLLHVPSLLTFKNRLDWLLTGNGPDSDSESGQFVIMGRKPTKHFKGFHAIPLYM
jgi:hypothetical protein